MWICFDSNDSFQLSQALLRFGCLLLCFLFNYWWNWERQMDANICSDRLCCFQHDKVPHTLCYQDPCLFVYLCSQATKSLLGIHEFCRSHTRILQEKKMQEQGNLFAFLSRSIFFNVNEYKYLGLFFAVVTSFSLHLLTFSRPVVHLNVNLMPIFMFPGLRYAVNKCYVPESIQQLTT